MQSHRNKQMDVSYQALPRQSPDKAIYWLRYSRVIMTSW